MRYAIIDNSTLTAVQRILGEIEVVNTTSFDGDIAAFEGLIQAILFYDQLFYIDDYKEEHRASRKAAFPYLTAIPSNTIHYGEIANAAAHAVDDVTLKAKAGKIELNPIGQFLEQLKMATTFTWDMQSSEWFLTMKMLQQPGGIDIEKYSALNDMIFLELSSNKATHMPRMTGSSFEFVGSDGRKIDDKEEITRQVMAFAASLSWLASRTVFYTYLSSHYDADVILHPIRSAFQLSYAGKLGLPRNTYTPVLERLSEETTQIIKDISKASDPIIVDMELPIFSAWLVEKAGDPRGAIALAFEMRNEKPIRDARAKLQDIELLSKEPDKSDYIKSTNILVRDLIKAGNVLRQRYGVSTKNGIPLSPLITVINLAAKLNGMPTLPALPIKVSMPDKLLEIGLRSGFKGVCRSITQDLVSIGRLGSYHELLTSSVQFEDGEKKTYLAKTENIRFFGKGSHWKRPM